MECIFFVLQSYDRRFRPICKSGPYDENLLNRPSSPCSYSPLVIHSGGHRRTPSVTHSPPSSPMVALGAGSPHLQNLQSGFFHGMTSSAASPMNSGGSPRMAKNAKIMSRSVSMTYYRPQTDWQCLAGITALAISVTSNSSDLFFLQTDLLVHTNKRASFKLPLLRRWQSEDQAVSLPLHPWMLRSRLAEGKIRYWTKELAS